ncbi:MAG: response regulator transcription factor [Crocinitomicaceae bacterium]|jgi:DNA-binding NarL/FixJ family response regulator|nr:response regulator transcription factor [Crocinitomicaceae bacterium]
MINIGIFEDHPIVLTSLIKLMETQPDFHLLFSARTKEELYTQLDRYNAEIVVVDMIANDVFGMEVYEYLHKNYPLIKVISFTSLSSPVLVENLLNIHVKGYVNKNQEPEDLIQAIRKVHAGKISLPNDYDFLSKNYTINKTNLLSEREIEIIQLISREFTTQDISAQLQIAVNTVENHRKKIFLKLNVKNVAGMVREAVKMGYI